MPDPDLVRSRRTWSSADDSGGAMIRVRKLKTTESLVGVRMMLLPCLRSSECCKGIDGLNSLCNRSNRRLLRIKPLGEGRRSFCDDFDFLETPGAQRVFLRVLDDQKVIWVKTKVADTIHIDGESIRSGHDLHRGLKSPGSGRSVGREDLINIFHTDIHPSDKVEICDRLGED